MAKAYSKEEKIDAVELLSKVGPAKASKQLGIRSSTLYKWRTKYAASIKDQKSTGNSATVKDSTLVAEITKLKEENKALLILIKRILTEDI